MTLEHKYTPLTEFDVKAEGDIGWQVAGYASTFGGEPDAYGDVVAKGAFVESIAKRRTKFLYEHRDPIGAELLLAEDDKGLFGTWSILKEVPKGIEAHALAQAGVLDSLSIGFRTLDSEFREDGTRVLKKIDLREVSLVIFPANESALVTGVKSEPECLMGTPVDGRDPEAACMGCILSEQRATWTTAYVNSLSDSAFAVIEPGGKKDDEGKTTPRSLRHLPHHNAEGTLDLPHLRNALARLPQTKLSDALKAKAGAHLNKHANSAGVGKSDDETEVPEHAPSLLVVRHRLDVVRRRLERHGLLDQAS